MPRAKRPLTTSQARGAEKDPGAFRNISETAELLGVRNHVLRFWEGRFPQLKPMKRAGNRRLYRPEDLELLFGIRQLLHNDAYTIKGVQKILREDGIDKVKAIGKPLVQLGQQSDADNVVDDGPKTSGDGGVSGLTTRLSSEGLPMLRDAVELAIVELEVSRAILLGQEEPTSVRRRTG